MAISYVGVTAYTEVVAGTLVRNVPAGVVDGDKLLAMVGAPSGGTLPGSLAGWTQIFPSTAWPSYGPTALYYRDALSEPASYTFANASGSYTSGLIVAYRGCAPGPPSASHLTASGSGDTIVTVSDNAWVVNLFNGYPMPSMFANDTNRVNSAGGAYGLYGAVGDRVVAAHGSSPSGSAGGSATAISFSVELDLPAGAPKSPMRSMSQAVHMASVR